MSVRYNVISAFLDALRSMETAQLAEETAVSKVILYDQTTIHPDQYPTPIVVLTDLAPEDLLVATPAASLYGTTVQITAEVRDDDADKMSRQLNTIIDEVKRIIQDSPDLGEGGIGVQWNGLPLIGNRADRPAAAAQMKARLLYKIEHDSGTSAPSTFGAAFLQLALNRLEDLLEELQAELVGGPIIAEVAQGHSQAGLALNALTVTIDSGEAIPVAAVPPVQTWTIGGSIRAHLAYQGDSYSDADMFSLTTAVANKLLGNIASGDLWDNLKVGAITLRKNFDESYTSGSEIGFSFDVSNVYVQE